MPKHFLSPSGVIVEADAPICAGWIYRTDSPVCWMEYIVSDKSAPIKQRAIAVDMLVNTLCDMALAYGASCVMMGTSHAGLGRKLLDKGFVETDTGMTHYIRRLG